MCKRFYSIFFFSFSVRVIYFLVDCNSILLNTLYISHRHSNVWKMSLLNASHYSFISLGIPTFSLQYYFYWLYRSLRHCMLIKSIKLIMMLNYEIDRYSYSVNKNVILYRIILFNLWDKINGNCIIINVIMIYISLSSYTFTIIF